MPDDVHDYCMRCACTVALNRIEHASELILLVDHNPFSKGGVLAWKYISGTSEMSPLYPRDYDERADWTGPAQEIADREVVVTDDDVALGMSSNASMRAVEKVLKGEG